MQALVIETDLSQQAIIEVESPEANGTLTGHTETIQKMGNIELEQFVRNISALGDCI